LAALAELKSNGTLARLVHAKEQKCSGRDRKKGSAWKTTGDESDELFPLEVTEAPVPAASLPNSLGKLNQMFPGLDYKVTSGSNDPADPWFRCMVHVERQKFRGQGRNKKLARYDAAENALRTLGLWSDEDEMAKMQSIEKTNRGEWAEEFVSPQYGGSNGGGKVNSLLDLVYNQPPKRPNWQNRNSRSKGFVDNDGYRRRDDGREQRRRREDYRWDREEEGDHGYNYDARGGCDNARQQALQEQLVRVSEALYDTLRNSARGGGQLDRGGAPRRGRGAPRGIDALRGQRDSFGRGGGDFSRGGGVGFGRGIGGPPRQGGVSLWQGGYIEDRQGGIPPLQGDYIEDGRGGVPSQQGEYIENDGFNVANSSISVPADNYRPSEEAGSFSTYDTLYCNPAGQASEPRRLIPDRRSHGEGAAPMGPFGPPPPGGGAMGNAVAPNALPGNCTIVTTTYIETMLPDGSIRRHVVEKKKSLEVYDPFSSDPKYLGGVEEFDSSAEVPTVFQSFDDRKINDYRGNGYNRGNNRGNSYQGAKGPALRPNIPNSAYNESYQGARGPALRPNIQNSTYNEARYEYR